jgi:hypothetical protein
MESSTFESAAQFLAYSIEKLTVVQATKPSVE